MIVVPNALPYAHAWVSDHRYLSRAEYRLRHWYKTHDSYPKDEREYYNALLGPAISSDGDPPSSMSFYAQNGRRLRYQVVVVDHATGPATQNLSSRPALVYYAVSSDYQQYWLALTGLDTALSPEAKVKPTSTVHNGLAGRLP